MKIIRSRIGIIIAVGLALLAVLPLLTVQAQAQYGTNWTGQFFNTRDLTGSVVATASYPSGINQNWPGGTPKDGTGTTVPGVNATNYSGRFTSQQTLAAGTYTFILTYDDGVRFRIDNTLVIDDFTAGATRSKQAQVTLTGGVYTLTVEYFQDTSDAALQISWLTSTTATGTVTPAGPTATPVPPATGVLNTVRGLSVRTGPYIGATLVAVARPDTTYNILASNRSEGVFTWYLLQIGENKTGWASGRYLTVTGNTGVVAEQATIFDQIDNTEDKGVIGQTRSPLNMRVRPSERTGFLVEIPWGAAMNIVGRTRQAGRDKWYQVRYEGRIGWILAPYVKITQGFIDAVPVR